MGIYTYTYAYAYTSILYLCTPSAAPSLPPSLPPSLLPPHALLHATRAPLLARKDWGSRFGVVTTSRERASRAPDPQLPDQTLNPNLCSLRLRMVRFYIP